MNASSCKAKPVLLPEYIVTKPTPEDAELDLARPIPLPPDHSYAGWWRLPALALLCVGLLWAGLEQQARLAAKAPRPQLAGPTVSFDFSPEGAARARALLATQGLQLVETEEGVRAMPTNLATDTGAAASGPDVQLPAPPKRPQIAIIIDDVGLVKARSLRAANLPAGFTLAFLPYAEGLQPLVDRAKANGHEIMLHLPMEGAANHNPGPQALLTGLSAAERKQRLQWNLARFQGFAGVNNHMGSSFTEDAPGMVLVLAELKRRKLFFIDSRTTGRSAARQAAADLSLPYAERDVFLDNDQDSSHIAIQLAETEARARTYGTAIAIGHPHAATIATLAAWQKGLAARGFDLVPASRIIAARQTPFWRLAVARQAGATGG
jgi:polysaccharide deacetylase 2 family uncharacterized protein YibQ